MDFGPDHWAWDWELLKRVAEEWARIREYFKLGSKATREQIEEFWDAIFKEYPADWPNLRQLHQELLQDLPLKRHLGKCYWKILKPKRAEGLPVPLSKSWRRY